MKRAVKEGIERAAESVLGDDEEALRRRELVFVVYGGVFLCVFLFSRFTVDHALGIVSYRLFLPPAVLLLIPAANSAVRAFESGSWRRPLALAACGLVLASSATAWAARLPRSSLTRSTSAASPSASGEIRGATSATRLPPSSRARRVTASHRWRSSLAGTPPFDVEVNGLPAEVSGNSFTASVDLGGTEWLDRAPELRAGSSEDAV